MPGSVIGTKLNYGYAGQVSRHGDEVSRTFPVNKTSEVINFGAPCKLNNDGTISLFKKGDKAEDFCGIAMRRVKSAIEYPNQNQGYYMPLEACDVLERGSMTVVCQDGAPKVNGQVYAYVEGPARQGFGSNAGENAVELPGLRWATGKDANGIAELTILNRVGI